MYSWRQKGILRMTQSPSQQWRSPLITPDMSARDAEDMANAMLLDSPLPNDERSEEGLLRGSGSEKLLEEKDGEKLPVGGNTKLPEETPTGKLIKPCTKKSIFSLLLV
jgi:hypothetical protein